MITTTTLSFLLTLNTIIFALLSFLHMYWLSGGRWGIYKAVPQVPGKESLKPVIWIAVLIIVGAFLMALIQLFVLFSFQIPIEYFLFGKRGLLVISALFLLRSIGDFRYIGIFRKIKNTEFAKTDARISTPLCLYISISNAYCFFSV